MTKQIPLGGKKGTGFFALVDDCDYEKLSQYRWSLNVGGYASGGGRAARELGHHFMHRVVYPPTEGLMPDHINGDRLDNRRENLRLVTPSQNMMNTKIRSNKVSKYKGVWWNAIAKLWACAIQKEGVSTPLGYYRTQRDAAIAYNEAARIHFGEYAKLNDIPEFDEDDKRIVKIRPRRGGISNYTGVTNKGGGWEAFIGRNGKKRNLGTYPSEKFAALVYDAAAIERYGEDAIQHVNFPELISHPLDLKGQFVFKATPKNGSIYAGVQTTTGEGNWFTRYVINGKREYWSFETAIEAAERYDKNVLLHDKHKAIYLNFPENLKRYLVEINSPDMLVQVPDATQL